MKKFLYSFLIVCAVLCLASCNLFKSPGEARAAEEHKKELVQVYFCPAKSKALVSDYQGSNVEFYLTATPNFARGSRTIVGTVSAQKLSKNQDGSYNAGYFEQGSWTFKLDAVLVSSDGQTQSSVIATQTITPVYISKDNSTVEFVLHDTQQAGDKGNVVVSVKVPRLSAAGTGDYNATFKAYIDESATPTDMVTTVATATDLAGSDLLLFSGTLSGLDAGCHTIKFVYSVNSKIISAETVEVRVVKNADACVSGTMLSGEYVTGTISVTYVTNKWKLDFASGSKDKQVNVNTETTITAVVTGAEGASSGPTYQWYKEGAKVAGSTGASYKFKGETSGIYSISCVATVDGISKSIATYVYVN